MLNLTPVKNEPHLKATPCVICGGGKWDRIYQFNHNDGKFYILRCQSCGHMLVDPIPLMTLDSRTMDADADEISRDRLLSTLHEILVLRREMESVKSYMSQKQAKVLDIGCGTGWAASIWQKNGFVVSGLEPSQNRTNIAQNKYNLKIYNSHIENFTTPEKYDIIIMRHLLEHIEEPSRMLLKIQDFLKPGGILFIVIPNINCIGRYIFRENWEWILPLHLHFYTPTTLTRLLEKSGYQKLKIYQMPSPLWYPTAINKALFGEASARRLPPILAFLISLPIVLLGFILNLNDNMTLIFQNTNTK